MHRKRGLRFEKSQLSFAVGRRRLTFACTPRPCSRCRKWFGADGKVIIERLCISLPYVEKPFNSKLIKSFVPELRSKVVRVSGFLCYLYMSYEHSMYISRIHVWLCNTRECIVFNIRDVLVCAYSIFCQISIPCTIPCGSSLLPSYACSCISFVLI